MPFRELDEAAGRIDRGSRLRLPERLERYSAGEAVRVPGRHVVLIENAGDLPADRSTQVRGPHNAR